MIPYILAAVGGYLIGQSRKETYADGGVVSNMSNKEKGKVFSFLDDYNLSDEVYNWWERFGYTKDEAKDIENSWAISRGYKMSDGGMMAKGGLTDEIKLYYHKTSGGAEYLMSTPVEGTKEGSFDSKYTIRIDGAKKYGGELYIKDENDRKEIKLYYHKTSGGAEYLMSTPVEGTNEGSFDSEYIVRIDGAKNKGGELIISTIKMPMIYADGGMMAKGGTTNSIYVVSDIEYDVDEDDLELPQTLEIPVPIGIKGTLGIEDYLGDEITERTGQFHKGFNYRKKMASGGTMRYEGLSRVHRKYPMSGMRKNFFLLN